MRTIVKTFETALIVVGVAAGLTVYMIVMGSIIGSAIVVQHLREMRTPWRVPLANGRA